MKGGKKQLARFVSALITKSSVEINKLELAADHYLLGRWRSTYISFYFWREAVNN